jgi:hypothetical protein
MLREARALAKARHDGIEPIHWVDVTAEGPLLVLDLPDGEPLESRLATGPLGIDQTRELGIQLAEALSAVHYHGIVHRAISVASVRLLADDKVMLGTFTFAKGFEARPMQSSIDHKRRKEPAIAPYLPPYVAPEQLAGQGANPRTDVFALGCLLYRCLTGSDPPQTVGEASPLADLRAKRPDAPKALCEVLRRCTHLAATARYPSAQAAAEALRATRPAAKGAPLMRRRDLLLTSGTLAALVLGGLGYWLRPGAEGPGDDVKSNQVLASTTATTGKFEPSYAKCYGLFIGVADAYDGVTHVKLKSPVREVKEVRQKLIANDPKNWREDSMKLLTEHDADKTAILNALEHLEDVAQPEDGVLLYFSGHGVKEGDYQYFLVPAGTTGRDPNHGSGYLPGTRIQNFFSQCKAKHVLAVFDCCYSGSLFALPERTRGRPATQGQAAGGDLSGTFLRHPARQMIASSSAAAADSTRMSAFCEAFLFALSPSPKGPYSGFLHARLLHSCILTQMGVKRAGGDIQESVLEEMTSPDGSFVFFLPK